MLSYPFEFPGNTLLDAVSLRPLFRLSICPRPPTSAVSVKLDRPLACARERPGSDPAERLMRGRSVATMG
jgi:hypothetical protein